MPDHEHPDGLMFPDMPDAGDVIVVDQLNPREQRLVGQHRRELLRHKMEHDEEARRQAGGLTRTRSRHM